MVKPLLMKLSFHSESRWTLIRLVEKAHSHKGLRSALPTSVMVTLSN